MWYFLTSDNDALRRIGVVLFVIGAKLNRTAKVARAATALRAIRLLETRGIVQLVG
jgi:hypothetical protein